MIEFRSGFVSLLGLPNAGKSSLLNALTGAKLSIVSPKPQTTRSRITGIKTTDNAQVIFVDIPGVLGRKHQHGALEKQLRSVVQETVADAEATIIVADVRTLIRDGAGNDVRIVDTEIERVMTLQRQVEHLPRVIALNKIDTITKPSLLPVIAALEQRFLTAGQKTPEIIPISARTGEGVDTLFERCVHLLPVGPMLFDPDEITEQSEQFIASEILREVLFEDLHAELPYSVAVEIESWEVSDSLLRIAAIVYVERTSQRPIVLGEGGKRIKAIGTRARQRLEEFFESKIYLSVFVQVAERWTESEKGLRRVGVVK